MFLYQLISVLLISVTFYTCLSNIFFRATWPLKTRRLQSDTGERNWTSWDVMSFISVQCSFVALHAPLTAVGLHCCAWTTSALTVCFCTRRWRRQCSFGQTTLSAVATAVADAVWPPARLSSTSKWCLFTALATTRGRHSTHLCSSFNKRWRRPPGRSLGVHGRRIWMALTHRPYCPASRCPDITPLTQLSFSPG